MYHKKHFEWLQFVKKMNKPTNKVKFKRVKLITSIHNKTIELNRAMPKTSRKTES